MTTRDIAAIADRCERGRGSDNALDVMVEVALFRPDEADAAIRANAAGTKVIYTGRDGRDRTHWAPDWTSSPEAHAKSAALLRSYLANHIDG